MLDRLLRRQLAARLAASPAVALVGPRQVGKTTLAQAMGGRYFDLEQDQERLRVDLAWDGLAATTGVVVFDEAQTWPALFPRLRGEIDRDRRRMGRFLLLGSVSPALMREVSEALTGRLAIVELTPLLAAELPTRTPLDRLWLCGGYPDGGILDPQAFPRWQRDYLALLAQRDLPAWGLSSKPQTTERLFRMLAATHGQVWNASQIGQALGLSYHTVNGYLDYLDGAFLIRRLPAYQANVRKRLVKSPRVYWRDSGLLHALLNVADRDALLAQPWVGASWEGFVIEQALDQLAVGGRAVTPYYFRTSDQYEVDLVLDFGTERWAVEIKLTSSPSTDEFDRLDRVADMIGAERRLLVTRTTRPVLEGRRQSHNMATFGDALRRAGRPNARRKAR